MLSRLDPGHRPVYEVSGGAEALAKLDGGNWQMLILDPSAPIWMQRNLPRSRSGCIPEFRFYWWIRAPIRTQSTGLGIADRNLNGAMPGFIQQLGTPQIGLK